MVEEQYTGTYTYTKLRIIAAFWEKGRTKGRGWNFSNIYSNLTSFSKSER